MTFRKIERIVRVWLVDPCLNGVKLDAFPNPLLANVEEYTAV
jgi:hypothetical protein